MSGSPSKRPGGLLNQLAQAAPATPSAAQQLHAKQVQDGRKKFYNHLEDHVLDYFHNHPSLIEACLNTCIKMFGNVVNNPTEEKYRKVKAINKTIRETLMQLHGSAGEDLLLSAGWLPRVVDMEKYWVFDADAESVRFGVLKEALHLCERALATVHEKAEKKRLEREEKLHKETSEKERIRLAIEEDKAQRKLRSELTAAHAPAVASPLGPAAASAAAAAPGRASPSRRPPGGGHRLGGTGSPGGGNGS